MTVKLTFDVLSDELIAKIKKYPATADVLKTNLTDWDPNLIGTSGVILLYYLKDELLEEVKFEIINKFPELRKHKFSIAFTLGSRLSYIQWHCDQGHKYSITLYLNEHWNRDFGGALIYQDNDDSYKAVYPEFNKAVSFAPPVWHSTTMPTLLAPLRESLQIFCD
jgi:Rps23 Pro-64 3,4-dihydroxylase Tpa1-like proline 4-hydroxylase